MRKIALVLAVVALLWGAIVLLQRRDEGQDRAERVEGRLLQFDDREVSGVLVTFQGQVWRFQRDSDSWRLVKPVADAVNLPALEALMVATRRTPVERVIEDPESLSDYGLDPPVASIELEGVDAPRLDLGDITPTGEGVFARVEERPGVLVLGDIQDIGAYLAQPNPMGLRDAGLLGMARSEIVGLELSSAAGDVALEHELDGWWVVQPQRMLASDREVGHLLQAFEDAEIVGFLDERDSSDPALGLRDAALRVTIRSASVSRLLVLGADREEDRRFATRDDRGTVLAVRMDSPHSLPLQVSSLTAERLSRINRYQVSRFSYRFGGRELVAVREDEQWTSEGGDSISEEEIYGLLVGVLELPVSG